jgi:hypothetical protein
MTYFDILKASLRSLSLKNHFTKFFLISNDWSQKQFDASTTSRIFLNAFGRTLNSLTFTNVAFIFDSFKGLLDQANAFQCNDLILFIFVKCLFFQSKYLQRFSMQGPMLGTMFGIFSEKRV